MEDEDICIFEGRLDCFFCQDQELVTFRDQDGGGNSIQVRSIILIETPNLTMFDGAVMSWNPATGEYGPPNVSDDD